MVQWRGRRQSGNIRDLRGRRVSQGAGMGMLPFLLIRFLGFKGVVVLALIFGALWLFVPGFRTQVGSMVGGQPVASQGPVPAGQEEEAEFAAVILADTEAIWGDIFAAEGADYPEPQMVLFTGGAQSGCGFASSAVGPFYCPADQTIYLDLAFFDELANSLGAAGDFAPAYVIAHEVGHHVQNVIGQLAAADRQRAGLSQTAQNAVQVQVELMADCFAGVWANHADRTLGILEPGDIQEGMGAAAAVGDDTLQRRAQGRVVPDSFTHGSAEQRQEWFMRGYERGQYRDCDTFADGSL